MLVSGTGRFLDYSELFLSFIWYLVEFSGTLFVH